MPARACPVSQSQRIATSSHHRSIYSAVVSPCLLDIPSCTTGIPISGFFRWSPYEKSSEKFAIVFPQHDRKCDCQKLCLTLIYFHYLSILWPRLTVSAFMGPFNRKFKSEADTVCDSVVSSSGFACPKKSLSAWSGYRSENRRQPPIFLPVFEDLQKRAYMKR
jgi:hypothetical protein